MVKLWLTKVPSKRPLQPGLVVRIKKTNELAIVTEVEGDSCSLELVDTTEVIGVGVSTVESIPQRKYFDAKNILTESHPLTLQQLASLENVSLDGVLSATLQLNRAIISPPVRSANLGVAAEEDADEFSFMESPLELTLSYGR